MVSQLHGVRGAKRELPRQPDDQDAHQRVLQDGHLGAEAEEEEEEEGEDDEDADNDDNSGCSGENKVRLYMDIFKIVVFILVRVIIYEHIHFDCLFFIINLTYSEIYNKN